MPKKLPFSKQNLETLIQGRDLVVFKTTKQHFLDATGFKQNAYFQNMMYGLEKQVQSIMDDSYYHKLINNLHKQYQDNDPLWTLTKIRYFADRECAEYYSPITVCYETGSKKTGYLFHPGAWRMAMLWTQQPTLKMTVCIDTSAQDAGVLIDKFTKNHFPYYYSKTDYDEFCELMNFSKFQGKMFVQDRVSGLNFSEDRNEIDHYQAKFHLGYNLNQRIFFHNSKPLVMHIKGHWKLIK